MASRTDRVPSWGEGCVGGRSTAIVVVITLLLLSSRPAQAGDWPQILGPGRDGHAEDEKLLSQWPASGPVVLWRYEIGTGFAGPAVVGDEVYIFHRRGDQEVVERLEAASGRAIWRTDFPASYQGGINPDNGPRCVPLVHGVNVYLLGADGDLHCVARQDGATKWSRALRDDFRAVEGYFGFGSTPIAMGSLLLVNAGGSPDAGIVALSLDTGQTVWHKTKEEASYASPTSATLDGEPCAIFATRYNTVAIDPKSGEVRFRFPFGRRGPTVNAATPLVFDGQLFLSAAYGVGCVLKRIDQPTPQDVWGNDQVMSSQYNTAVYCQGDLYGVHGREDVGTPELRCVEATSGKVRWKESGFGAAHLILADSQLLVLKVDGTLLLMVPHRDHFAPLAEARVSDHTTRALPALSAGRLFVRDNLPKSGTLYCLQVGRP